MPRPELCVGAIAIDQDRLLLIRRATEPGKGLWSLPGGRVEPGEMMQEAVVRELREETGVAAVCEDMVGWVQRISDTHHFVIFDFAVTVMNNAVVPRAGDDAAEASWIPLGDVAALALVDGLAEFLADHQIIRTFT